MPAVVDAQRSLADGGERAMPGPDPVRPPRAGVVAGSEQQTIRIGQTVLVDPLGEHGDEYRWDRHAPWSGFGFAGFIEGDVCFGHLQAPPPLGRQHHRADAEHDHFGGP